MLNNRKVIHTIISEESYNKIKVYGNGILNDGIEKIVGIIEE
jgi:hypothetical protein